MLCPILSILLIYTLNQLVLYNIIIVQYLHLSDQSCHNSGIIFTTTVWTEYVQVMSLAMHYDTSLTLVHMTDDDCCTVCRTIEHRPQFVAVILYLSWDRIMMHAHMVVYTCTNSYLMHVNHYHNIDFPLQSGTCICPVKQQLSCEVKLRPTLLDVSPMHAVIAPSLHTLSSPNSEYNNDIVNQRHFPSTQ